MTRDELEHAIRAACDVANDREVYVLGSQAILGQFPDAPASLRQSVEADVAPATRPDQVDRIDGTLGELSQFHEAHGFYVHGVPLETASLPGGWKKRVVKVQNENTLGCIGWCLEAHDLAASKLAAFRERDREFVRTMLAEELIDGQNLIRRVGRLPVADSLRRRLTAWVRRTVQELRAE